MKITILSITPSAMQPDPGMVRQRVTVALENFGQAEIMVDRPAESAEAILDTIEADIRQWMRAALERAGFIFLTENYLVQ